MAGVLGLDTSNYTTSAAWFDGTGGDNTGKLLEVPQGALGPVSYTHLLFAAA